MSFYDCDGERLGTLRMGRMPETKKATLKEMLSAEVEAALEQRPGLEVVKLADGAHDNWSFLVELAPQAVSSEQLVDFYHAAEQLKVATDTAYGEHDERGRTHRQARGLAQGPIGRFSGSAKALRRADFVAVLIVAGANSHVGYGCPRNVVCHSSP